MFIHSCSFLLLQLVCNQDLSERQGTGFRELLVDHIAESQIGHFHLIAVLTTVVHQFARWSCFRRIVEFLIEHLNWSVLIGANVVERKFVRWSCHFRIAEHPTEHQSLIDVSTLVGRLIASWSCFCHTVELAIARQSLQAQLLHHLIIT